MDFELKLKSVKKNKRDEDDLVDEIVNYLLNKRYNGDKQ